MWAPIQISTSYLAGCQFVGEFAQIWVEQKVKIATSGDLDFIVDAIYTLPCFRKIQALSSTREVFQAFGLDWHTLAGVISLMVSVDISS